MDGSAAAFVAAIDRVGTVTQSRPRRYLKVLKTVRVEHGRGFAELRPADRAASISTSRSTSPRRPSAASAARSTSIPSAFRSEMSRARTFGFVCDVERLWKMGFALGSSLENCVALDGERILNPEGLRYADEFVRHKALGFARRPLAGGRADRRQLPLLYAGPQDELPGAAGACSPTGPPMSSSRPSPAAPSPAPRQAGSRAGGLRRRSRLTAAAPFESVSSTWNKSFRRRCGLFAPQSNALFEAYCSADRVCQPSLREAARVQWRGGEV